MAGGEEFLGIVCSPLNVAVYFSRVRDERPTFMVALTASDLQICPHTGDDGRRQKRKERLDEPMDIPEV